jgi:hypothetical protein
MLTAVILYFQPSHPQAVAEAAALAVPVAQAVVLQTSERQAAPELRVKATKGAIMVPVLSTLAVAEVALAPQAATVAATSIFQSAVTAAPGLHLLSLEQALPTLVVVVVHHNIPVLQAQAGQVVVATAGCKAQALLVQQQDRSTAVEAAAATATAAAPAL